MANRNFPSNKLYNFHVMPVSVDMQVAIGATGAPTLSSAPGVKSITRLSPGNYRIQLQDNYNSLLSLQSNVIAPLSGSAIDPHTAVVDSAYQITLVGNTDWATAGVPSSITPAVGTTFVFAADPGVGTGRVKLIGNSGFDRIELSGSMMNSNSPATSNGQNGAFILIQCLQAQVPSATTQGTPIQYAAADPANGCTLEIRLLLNNSSVQ